MGSFTGPIKRVHVSPFYQLGLLITSFMMILLPLVYLALIAAMGYGIYYHAVSNTDWITMIDTGRGRALGMFLYIIPLMAGVIAVLFMIKPIFARYPLEMSSIDLDRNEEPLLFAFVEQICKSVRAPVPRVIRVDCRVNASASFRRGFFSFLSRDLVLTIGLPLVAGLNTRELAGVLAHEFGHFAQGFGMRLNYTIQSINMWFARVVYQRDIWDERLRRASQESDIRIGIMFYLARLFTWLNRVVLSVLMHLAHAISCFMSRQMEFDADKYKVRMIGSAAFAQALYKLHVMDAAHQTVNYDLYQFWKEGRLADNLAQMVKDQADELPQEITDKIRQHVEQSKTGLFSTHPSTRARIRAAAKQNTCGVFQLELPATDLLKNYAHAARITSLMYYRAMIGGAVHPDRLVAASELSRERSQKSEERKALDRYLLKAFNQLLPMPASEKPIERSADPRATARAVMEARERMALTIDATHEVVRQYAQAYEQLCQGMMAQSLISAGFTLPSGAFNLASPSKDSARQAQYTAQAELERLKSGMDLFVNDSQTRLIGSLQLLHDRNVQAHLNDPSLTVAEIQNLWRVLWRLSESFSLVDQLRRLLMCAQVVIRAYQENRDNEDLGYSLQRRVRELYQPLKSLFFIYNEEAYPFDTGSEGVNRLSIGRYLIGTLPASEVSPETLENSERAIESFYTLYFRVLGRLCAIAEKVETVIGLPPLEPPERDPLDS